MFLTPAPRPCPALPVVVVVMVGAVSGVSLSLVEVGVALFPSTHSIGRDRGEKWSEMLSWVEQFRN